MALNLHKDCKTRLIEFISDELSKTRINNDVHLNFDSILTLVHADEIIPKTGTIREKLNRFIGETPLFEFVYEYINRDIYENGSYNSGIKESFLSELPRYNNLNDRAKQMVEEFDSLPWNYLISFQLNDNIGKLFRQSLGNYDLSKNISLACPDAAYNQKYPLQSGIKNRDEWLSINYGSGLGLSGLFPSSNSQQWNQETSYLQFKAEGFIGLYSKTNPVEDVISMLKSFLGLTLAVRLTKIEGKLLAPTFVNQLVKSRIVVHREIDSKWQVWTIYELPDDLSETLNNLCVNNLDGNIDQSKISGRISLISSAFEHLKKAERILLAGQWLLDSYVGKNELLSFVQTIITMEILLGEKSKSDIMGISELLCNRCAYLIGRSHSQRASILRDFGKIYDVRSAIVHRGKSRLTSVERMLFRKLQWMCSRVIEEELNLLIKDKKST